MLVDASRDGLVDAAHDLSDGGLAQALVEACLRYGVGARVWLDEVCERDGVTPFVALFSESTARAVVAVPRSEEVRFTDMCAARRIPFARIGVVDDDGGGEPVLDVQGLFTCRWASCVPRTGGPCPAVVRRLTGTSPRASAGQGACLVTDRRRISPCVWRNRH